MSNKLKKKHTKNLVQKFLPTFHLRIAMHLRNTDSITYTVLSKTGWGWVGGGKERNLVGVGILFKKRLFC